MLNNMKVMRNVNFPICPREVRRIVLVLPVMKVHVIFSSDHPLAILHYRSCSRNPSTNIQLGKVRALSKSKNGFSQLSIDVQVKYNLSTLHHVSIKIEVQTLGPVKFKTEFGFARPQLLQPMS